MSHLEPEHPRDGGLEEETPDQSRVHSGDPAPFLAWIAEREHGH